MELEKFIQRRPHRRACGKRTHPHKTKANIPECSAGRPICTDHMQLGECEEGAKAISELFKNESGVASHTRTWSFEFDQSVKRVIDIQMLFVLSSFPLLLFSSVPFFNLPRFFFRSHWKFETVPLLFRTCVLLLLHHPVVPRGGGIRSVKMRGRPRPFWSLEFPIYYATYFPPETFQNERISQNWSSRGPH